MTRIKRRIEVTAFESERLSISRRTVTCPACHTETEFLTALQAAAMIQVPAEDVRRWVADGKAHGVMTPDSGLRICRNSLLMMIAPPVQFVATD